MKHQGHVHAENMALYAEDAKNHEKPWRLWQARVKGTVDFFDMIGNPNWDTSIDFRRKPETKIITQYEFKVYSINNGIVFTCSEKKEDQANSYLDDMLKRGDVLVSPVTKKTYEIEV